eukprot:3877684-Lingulodinium_polyedra.AAC.1
MTNPEINARHSLEDVQQYVAELKTENLATAYDPSREVPYDSTSDWVQTMRAACVPQGVFRWPSESLGFQRAVTVAVQRLPPGH